MKTNLKDNIWIEGFDDESRAYASRDFKIMQGCNSLWIGETSEIPEEISKECVVCIERKGDTLIWLFYKNYLGTIDTFPTAKQSIQSACDKPYCIIYKNE